mmetsp:Transcript_13588/g.17114  ORF Transcript_13588/g.17114 Transcript_13588/m.17114 type:complete len:180 (-) Transcript_13588:58-597(-)
MWFGSNKRNIPNLMQFHREPAKAEDCWHVLHSIHSSYDELLAFVKLIRPRQIIPWTECSSSTLQVMKTFLNPTPRRNIEIPRSLANKFPFLLRQEGDGVTIESKAKQQPETNTSVFNSTPDIISCWSPSPPQSIPNTSDDEDCIMLESFEFPFCKAREKEPNLGDFEFSPPEKRRRIGW